METARLPNPSDNLPIYAADEATRFSHIVFGVSDLDRAEEKFVVEGAGIVDCGPATKYRVGQVERFDTGTFFLVRLRDGFLALSRWCTHMNGQVGYQREHWHFACPNHDATFDRCGV